MKQPSDVMALVGQYGAMVDSSAKEFLTRGTYDMYGMMRYFMGYADEQLQPTKEVFGGKRFRSGICLMLADQYGALQDALPVALSVEVFHNFTLIHDDLEDRDELRRGRPTVWKIWGPNHAINSGDGQLILALMALERAAPDIQRTVRPFLLEKYLEVIEGQFLDFTLTDYDLSDPRVTEDAFIQMLTKKTSVLVGAATRAAGQAARVSADEQEKLWQFGLSLGLAYQLCDDTVSIWGSAEMTGKEPHGDVREKKKTLPVLYTAHTLTGMAQVEFMAMFSNGGQMNTEQVHRAIVMMNSVDAYTHARARVDAEKDKALAAVAALAIPDGGKAQLTELVSALLPSVTP